MADYIDREAFIGWLKTIPLKDISDGLGLCRVIMEEDFKRCIKNIPKSAFIDAEPVVHGHWIEEDGCIETFAKCSVCGYRTQDNKYYCQQCGAKMDEVMNNENK